MNYKSILALLVFIISGLLLPLSADADKKPVKSAAYPASFNSGLSQIISHAPPNTHFGLIIESMQTGKVLFAYNADYLFMPASVQKLFVAIPALAILKPDYKFKTQAVTNEDVDNGALKGDLAIRFVGDPTLQKSDIINLIGQLKKQGIHAINGHVYIDNTAYDNVPYPPGWFWDDLSYRYAAPMNAVIINENQFSIVLTPSNVLNMPAMVKVVLPEGVVKVQNETVTTSKNTANCPLAFYSDFDNNYKITGCIPQNGGKQYRSLALRDPQIYARVLVQEYLQYNQISFNGPVMLSRNPVYYTNILAEHDSAPLNLIVKKMLKHSDNLITNALLKKIGQVYYGSQGSWRTGIFAMRALLAKNSGIDFNHLLIADGAGLSRYNLITPHSLVKLLYYAYHHDKLIDHLLEALPIAGVDGTLRWRMPDLGKNENVHAKTGSMHGVSALAGYVNTKNNGTLGFAIIMNGFVNHNAPYRSFQDRICQYLVIAPHS